MSKYLTIKNCGKYDGLYEVVGKHQGASSWEQTLELRKVLNPEEHIAWEICEAASILVYAHRSNPSNITSAKIKLAETIKEFMP